MSKKITKEIAQKFFGDTNSIDLDEFAHELLAAAALDIGWLPGGLTSLSDRPAHIALASINAAHNGGDLRFKKLTHLSSGAAAALAKYHGQIWFDSLEILSDVAAHALSQHQGVLGLPAIRNLSNEAAAALAKHKGEIILKGLRKLSNEPGHIALSEALARENSGANIDLCELTSLSNSAATALAKHKGELLLYALKELSDSAITALAKHKDVRFISEELRAAVALARKAKPVSKSGQISKTSNVNCDATFMKQVNTRWKRELLIKDDFKSPEKLLNAMISNGKSLKDIVGWMEVNNICSGGDAACQRAVEVAWLMGAWDVSWSVCSSEEAENQDPSELVQETAEIVAKMMK